MFENMGNGLQYVLKESYVATHNIPGIGVLPPQHPWHELRLRDSDLEKLDKLPWHR